MAPDTCPENTYDVIVAGGGPAGSTVAGLLARAGHSVCLVEKEAHPRFHIGESLLPWNMPILERLGVLEEVTRIGVKKPAADFTAPLSADFVRFDFAGAFDPTPPTAFQVRRSQFDELLFRHAGRLGAHTLENARIGEVAFDPDGVTATFADDARPPLRARFFVDATGRDTLLGRKFAIKERHPKHRSAAAFGHFENVPRREGRDAGNISIYWFDEGWIWMIPLSDGVVSVGVVAGPGYFKRHKDNRDAFDAGIRACPPAAERLTAARATTEIIATGNFSYFCNRMYGERHLLVGDAFAFLDPVFSSGVFVAMSSAERAAGAIETWFRDRRQGERAFAALERRVRRGIGTLWWFIDRFNTPALQRLFMGPRNIFGMQSAVLSVLAGDIYGNRRLWLPLLMFRGIYRVVSAFTRHRSANSAADRAPG